MSYPQLQMLIAGEWTNGTSGVTENVICPADGTVLGELPHASKEDLDDALNSSLEGFNKWRSETPLKRQSILEKAAKILEREFDKNSENLTREMGKPLAEAKGEITYAASFLEFYAEEAKRIHGSIVPAPSDDRQIVVLKQPVGVVASITPWNFPAAMITRKVGPALAAGCTVVAKPATQTPLSAFAMAELAGRAGVPKGVFSVLTGKSGEIGGELTSNPKVRKLTFTGSTEVGRLLMEQGASTIKKMSMELGGNAPFIVFEGADVDAERVGQRRPP